MRASLVLAGAIPALLASPVQAATVTDPVGDFLPTFVGTKDADLDLTSFSASYDASLMRYLLQGTVAGAIDASTVGIYVIGVNTGAGARAPFGTIGAPNVRFDNVILVRQDGTGAIDTTPPPLPVFDSNITISGNTFSVILPASTFTSTVRSAVELHVQCVVEERTRAQQSDRGLRS
jgi:hypothetical protein